MKKLMLGLALFTSYSAFAIDFKINCTNSAACDHIKSEMEKKAKEDLPDVGLGKYGDGVSNSVAVAGRDNSDYSDRFSLFALKAGVVGVGLDGDLDKMDEAGSVNGFGIQSTLQVGVNMGVLPIDKVGPVELKKLDLFASAYSQNATQDGKTSSAEGEISSLGFSARYHLVEGKDVLPGYMLEWGGLFVHAGFRYSKMNLKLTQDIEGEIEKSGVKTEFDKAYATFEMDSAITSIPIEISTYVRMLYVVTLYGGLGADINSGTTSVDLSGKGKLKAEGHGEVGNFKLSEDAEGKASSFVTRGFAGLQFNVPFVRIYAQAHKVFGEDVIGAQVGAKILY